MVTLGGGGGGGGGVLVTVTVAVAVLLESPALVAVTVTVPAEAGAVNIPEEEIVPALADQLTELLVLPVTLALNCCVALVATVALAGLTETAVVGVLPVGVALLPPPPQPPMVIMHWSKTSMIAVVRYMFLRSR